jgi:hypothetical protein
MEMGKKNTHKFWKKRNNRGKVIMLTIGDLLGDRKPMEKKKPCWVNIHPN